MPPQTMRQFLTPPEKAPDTLPRTQSTMSLLDYFSTVIQGLADPTGWTEPKAEDFDNPHAYTQALKAHGVGQLLGMAAPLAAPLAAALKLKGVRQGTSTIAEYQGIHAPPMADSGAPLHDLTGGGRIYPDDVYSPKAAQYYGPGGDRNDVALFRQIHALKDKPDATVKVWRAVPKNAPVSEIQHGDWVTISKKYAQEHGEGPLRGDYKLIEAEVPAKTLFTNGDSPYEFGLDLSVLPPEAPQTLKAFHGTRSTSLIGDTLKPSTGGEFGPGIYLSKDPNTADFFATHVARGPEGPAIMPVNVDLKNPFRVTKTDWIKMTEKSTPSQVQKRLQKKGYDGIIGVGLTGQEQIVAFHPEQVQSVFKKGVE